MHRCQSHVLKWLFDRLPAKGLNRLLNLRFVQKLGFCPLLSRCCTCQEVLRTSVVLTYYTGISFTSCPWWHTCTSTVIPFSVKREAPMCCTPSVDSRIMSTTPRGQYFPLVFTDNQYLSNLLLCITYKTSQTLCSYKQWNLRDILSSCAIRTALVFSFFLPFLYFLSLLFTSSSYLSGMCSPKRQNRFQVSPRYLFVGFREIFPVGEDSGTVSWPLFPTTAEVKNERCEYSTSFYAFMTSLSQPHCTAIRRSRKITKSDYQLRHVCPSILPHGTTRLPIDGFSWNSVLEDFRKSVEKIQVSLKWTKIKGTWRPLYRFYHTSLIYS